MPDPIRIVTYNIQYSRGKDGAFDLARIADTVRGADIIGLQEVTRSAGVPFVAVCRDRQEPWAGDFGDAQVFSIDELVG